MKFLLTNDDGIEAEGLQVLGRAAAAEIVCALPAGLDTGVGDRRATLSH